MSRLRADEARRLAVTQALLKDAPVLILDEPTEGLDGPAARSRMETLRGLLRGRTVRLITHRTEGLDWMDQVWHSRQGRLEAGGQRDQGTNQGSETSLL